MTRLLADCTPAIDRELDRLDALLCDWAYRQWWPALCLRWRDVVMRREERE